jgi:amino acid transporter
LRIDVGRLLVGKPLATNDLEHQAISRPVGLAVFASDALSSTAYATEEILIILSLAIGAGASLWAAEGAGGFSILSLSMPIAIAIAVLLAIVTLSYRQTIHAYPGGGGAYIVARDNLGEVPAQVAGAALLTDYILTVAVSISSGVAQIVSAFPGLLPHRVGIALVVILLVTLVNLRGVKESGRIFAVPTYFFLVTMFIMIAVGFYKYFTGTLSVLTPTELQLESFHELQAHHGGLQTLGLFLVLRAFSSGCTALTGIEAISNGITAFKKPRSHNAAVTLMWMSGILIVIFLSLTFLANQVHPIPLENETVISQLGRAIFGENSLMWRVLLFATALILLMAANTSYADFPRLAALLARDGFLPRQLTYRGSRLVFSWGIMLLALAASFLVMFANARVTALIPLYAVGVFLSFTLSQAGMVVRMLRSGKLKPGEERQGLETPVIYDPGWRHKMLISAIGAVCTFVVMVVFAVTKFATGAWVIVVLIPMLVFGFVRIHNHYRDVARLLSRERAETVRSRPVHTIILIDNVHNETIRMVNFAKSLGHPWKAVHIGIHPDRVNDTLEKWNRRIGEGELVIVPSPFRQLTEPIRDYIRKVQDETPETFVHIIMGHLVMNSFWEQALHQNSAFIFNLALGQMENVVVTTVPYQIHSDDEESDDALSAEAAQAEPVPVIEEAEAPTQ